MSLIVKKFIISDTGLAVEHLHILRRDSPGSVECDILPAAIENLTSHTSPLSLSALNLYFDQNRIVNKNWIGGRLVFYLLSQPHLQVNLYTPHLALQEYVLSISTVNVVLPFGTENVITPYPPTPYQSLIFYCNHPIAMSRTGDSDFLLQPPTVIIGPQYSRVNIKVHRQLTAIRVDFVPGGLYRMLGSPMHELFDGGFDALDFFGAEMKSINDQLRNTLSMEEGKNIVERFLLAKVKLLKRVLPFDSAMQLLLNSSGNISIEKIASHSCLSLKQFERKCKERIGMNPKTYARILKFSKAYRLHEFSPHLSWTEIAYEAGYFDQMHMIRDFKVFAGVNPTVIENQLQHTPLRMQKDLRH